MRRLFLFAVVAAALTFRSAEAQEGLNRGAPVKIEKTWQGMIKLELRGIAPVSGFVMDGKTWATLWKQYRPTEDVPEVNFAKEVVLVAVNSDPNSIGISASLDDKGDLRVTAMSTLIGFVKPTTCAYQFALIRKAGIKSIGGKALLD